MLKKQGGAAFVGKDKQHTTNESEFRDIGTKPMRTSIFDDEYDMT